MKISSFLVLVLAFSGQAHGQQDSYSKELSSLLVKHSVVLRHFYTDVDLRFDTTGQLQSRSAEGFGPSDGRFIVERVHLSPDTLELTGRRVIEIFNSDSNTWQLSELGKAVSVSIQLPQNKPAQLSVNRLLSAVFLTHAELGALQCSPEEARKLQEAVANGVSHKKNQGPPTESEATSLDQLQTWCLPGGDRAYRVGGGITAPKAKHTPDPDYTPEAKRQRIQGTVEMLTLIRPDGKPAAISIFRSIGSSQDSVRKATGYQLDTTAVETVSSWRFDPARFGDTAVPVWIMVEVNFRLF